MSELKRLETGDTIWRLLMIKKLRRKFVCINMAIVVVMLLTVLGTIFFVSKNNIERQNEGMMRNIAMNPMMAGRPDDRSGDIHLPFFTLQLGKDGKIIARGGGYYDLSDEEFLDEIMKTVEDSNSDIGTIDEYNLRYFKSFNPKDKTSVYVFSNISSSRDALKGLLKTCIGVFVAAFAVFLIISVLLARWAVKPVEEAWTKQKQFVSDASHELKTPLTVITTCSEMLASGELNEEQNKTLVSNIQTETYQMRGLVEEMLRLSRIETETRQETENLDFSRIVKEQVAYFEPVFFEKGLSICENIEDGIIVRGEKNRLGQAVEALIDNAQKYCHAGSETVVTLKSRQKFCELTVTDKGDAIPEKDLENIFERFYRADEARSLNHSYGLGLAIAKAAVESCGGEIKAESSNGNNSFIIILPII